MKQLFQSVDLFGRPVNLMVKQDQLYHTKVSVIFSILIITLSCVFFVYLFIDLVQLKNPNVTAKVEYSQNPELYILNKDNFRISVGFSSSGSEPLLNTDMRYFKILLMQCKLTLTSLLDKNCEQFEMVPCSNVKKNQLHEEVYFFFFILINKLELTPVVDKFTYCVSDEFWDHDSLSLQGTILSNKVNAFGITIRECNRETEQCASEQEFNDNFGPEGVLLISMVDYIKDDSNPTKPFKPINKLMYSSFQRNSRKDALFYCRHSIMKTITNLFYFQEETKEDHVLQYDRQLETKALLPFEKDLLVTLVFLIDENKYVYQRTYPNILTMMGNLKGLISFLTFACSILIEPIQRISMSAFLIKKVYSISSAPLEESKPTIFYRLQQCFKRTKAVKIQPLNPTPKSKAKSINFKTNELKIGFVEKIQFFISSNSNSLIGQCEQRLQKDLDVVYILNKLKEIDKLKYLILNKHQLTLFANLSKPEFGDGKYTIINDAQIEEYQNYMLDKRKAEEIQDDQLDAYQKLRNEQNCEINIKLLLLIDKRIKDWFQNNLTVIERRTQVQPQLAQESELEKLNNISSLRSPQPEGKQTDLIIN